MAIEGTLQNTVKLPIKIDLNKLKKANELVQKLNHSAETLTKPLNRMNDQFEKMTKSTSQWANTYRNDMKSASKATRDLSSASRGVERSFDRQSKSSRQSSNEVIRDQKRMQRESRTTSTHFKNIGNSTKGIGRSFQSVNRTVESSTNKLHGFRDVFLGTFAGTLVSNGISAIGQGMVGAVHRLSAEMSENTKAWQTFQSNMQMADKSAKQIKSVQKDLQSYAQKTIYSASDMASTYAQLTSVGVKNTEAVVKGFGGLAATAEEPAQAMKTLSTQATQMAAMPKVQWQDLRLMMQQAPAGIAQVSKKMGMSTKSLIKNVQAGKVTSEEFLAAIAKAGNDKHLQNMATHYKTMGQAMDGFWETAANKSQDAFQNVSKVGIKAVSSVTDALGKVSSKDLAKGMQPMITSMSKFITFVIKNGGNFATIGGAMARIIGSMAKGAWSAIVTTINLIAGKGGNASHNMKNIADSLDSISRHETLFKTLGVGLVTYFAVGKVFKIASGIGLIAKNLGLVSESAEAVGGGSLLTKIGSAMSPSKGTFVGKYINSKGLTKVKPRDINATTRVSRYGSKGLTAKIGSKLPSLAKGGSMLKGVAGKIPYLDVAVAGSSLIGMKKKNAGSKIGQAGGTLAGMEGGAALGGLIGSVVPVVGTGVGAAVGGAIGAVGGGSIGKKVGKSIQKALPSVKKSISKFFSGIGKFASKSIKGVGKFFGGVGSVINKKIIKPLKSAFKTVAHIVSYPFVTAVGLVAMAWDKMKKPITKFAKWIGKKLRAIGKTIGKLWKAVTNPIIKVWKKVWSTVKGAWNSFSKWIGKKWSSFAKSVGRLWNTITAPIKRVWHATMNVVKGAWSAVSGWLSKQWSNLAKIAGNIFGAVKEAITKPIKAAWDVISGIFGKIGNAIGTVVDGVKGFAGKVGDFFGKAHKKGEKTLKGKASGGKISRNTMAVVGEAGQEMAYNPRTGKFRMLGANGTAVERLRAGEHILNARDTAKVLAGGLGKGMTLPGYATGTDKLTKRSRKTNKGQSDTYAYNIDNKGVTKAAKSTKKSMKSITKAIVGGYSDSKKGSSKQMNQMQKGSVSSMKSIMTSTKKYSQKTQSNTVADFDDMQKGSMKQMNQMHSGMNNVASDMVSDFGKIFGRLDNYAHRAMANAIKQLNAGIKGIDTVLGKFGGGGSVLPMIHYANGTNGAAAMNHMAMINDATHGPRQEAIVHQDGSYSMYKEHNKVVPIMRGDSVLNGTDTLKAQQRGYLPKYAKGKNSKEGLRKLIKTNDSHPKKAWHNDFSEKLGKTLSNAIAGGFQKTAGKGANKVGQPWYSTVWDVMSDAMSGGGSAAGGNWLHTPGAGWSGPSGAQRFGVDGGRGFPHDGVDFGAALGTPFKAMHGGTVTRAGTPVWAPGALGKVITIKSDDGWQEIYQEFGQMKNIKVSKGDNVKTGQTIGTLGPLNGSGSGAHLHVGVAHGSLWDHGGTSTKGWYDITKMHGGSDGSSKKHKKKKNNPLEKLVKKQLKSQIKYAKKNLVEDDLSSLGDIGAGGNFKSLAAMLRKAAEKMHATIPGGEYLYYLLNMIKNESGGREKIVGIDDHDGTGPAMGLMQYKRATFNAYKVKGHGNILSGWDQALAFFNNSHYKTDIGVGYNGKVGEWRGNASGPSGHRRFANGGWSNKAGIFGEVPGEPEVAINPKRKSADHLIAEAIQARASASSESPFAKVMNSRKAKKQRNSLRAGISKLSRNRNSGATSAMPKIEVHNTFNISGKIDESTLDAISTQTEKSVENVINKLFRQAYDKIELGNGEI